MVKIEQHYDSDVVVMADLYEAKYQIIQNVYGNYLKDTIEFETYDHFNVPAFSKYDYILLFVRNYDGRLYKEMCQYFDVYKTKNGRWASSYKFDAYNFNKNTTVKPEPIDFLEAVSYKLNITSTNKERMGRYFPAPYYKMAGDKAIAVWGNYVEQLFELEKEGILKLRGYF